MDYFATYPHTVLKYFSSNMVLEIHSDTGYLNESEARSCVGGHFYLGNDDTKPKVYNDAILNTTGILKHVASSSATEAVVSTLFVNTKEGEITCTTLNAMGYPQPATPITTDNSTTNGIMNDTI
jgi:hypothetical protein